MASMLDELMGSLQSSGGIGQLARTVGVGESDVSKALSGALPALLGGLTREAGSQGGAGSLMAALDRDHDGSVLDDLAGFLGNPENADAGILRHTFGDRQARVENQLSRSTGIDTASIGKILAMAAPLVLGYLSRQRQQQNLDAGGLAEMLGREHQVVRQRSPQAADMLSQLLDADGDGSILDDLAEKGSGILGSLFKT